MRKAIIGVAAVIALSIVSITGVNAMANDQIELGGSGTVTKLIAGTGVTLTPASGRGQVTIDSSATPGADAALANFIAPAGNLNAETFSVPFVDGQVAVGWAYPPTLLGAGGTLSVIADGGSTVPVGCTAMNVTYQLTNAAGTVHALFTAMKAQTPGGPFVLPAFADYTEISNVGADLVLSDNAGAPRITSTAGGMFLASLGVALS